MKLGLLSEQGPLLIAQRLNVTSKVIRENLTTARLKCDPVLSLPQQRPPWRPECHVCPATPQLCCKEDEREREMPQDDGKGSGAQNPLECEHPTSLTTVGSQI